ncbi:hypothetical protein, partial [Acidisphaera sp. L21]|uniref:beta strand repeat-containing protein n=1 Tax=Acidisphaera sp. L21 TaxID=1641851 RepID=UPI00131AAA87
MSGTSFGGALLVQQTANGGAGGYSNGGTVGVAGTATSNLTFNDNAANTTHTHSLTGGSIANGGTGGQAQTGTAGAGAAATANLALTGAYVVGQHSGQGARATGGTGGRAFTTGTGGAGGAATEQSVATSTTKGTDSVSALSYGQGGRGGGNYSGGSGGAGGAATSGSSTATETTATGGTAYAYVRQTGGSGGRGTGAGFTGGAGGGASGAIASASGNSADARIIQTGGNGGGDSSASGGAGAASTLTDAVSGTTSGGYLRLRQTANGGIGGYGTTSGNGGAATSALTFNDITANTTHATTGFTGSSIAVGGSGGSGSASTGGAATASLAITGLDRLNGTATATGGNSGNVGGTTTGTAGNATATSSATATDTGSSGTAIDVATATGGTGTAQATAAASATAATANGQEANASAQASGSSGTASSTAKTGGAGVIVAMSAISAATYAARALSNSLANISGNFYTFNSDGTFGTGGSENDISFMSGLPNAGTVTSVLNANSNLAAKLGTAQANVFGQGVLGGYDASSNGSQTYASTNSWTLNSTSLTGHLILGFSDDVSFGTGFTSLALSVSVGGAAVLSQSFTTLAAAQAYFDNDAVDLGAIASSANLVVSVTTTLVTSTLGAGFGEAYLLGTTGGNGPPVLTAPASKTVAQSIGTAIGGLNLTETGNTSGETFTVTLADTNGKLSATGTGITGSGTNSLVLTGTLAAVQADLSTVAINDATAGSDTITLNATDSLGGTATPASIAIAVNGAPVLTAPTTLSVTQSQTTAVAGVNLAESGTTSGETFTVTITDTNGILTATGASGTGTKSLSFSGTLAQVNAILGTLSDNDATAGADTIALNASDSLGGATSKSIAVTASAQRAPTITAPSTAVVGQSRSTAITGVTLAETGSTNTETFTVTAVDGFGLLSATGTGVSGAGTKSLTITGTLAQVTAALATLADTDNSASNDTITLNATNSLGGSASPATIAVTVNSAPSISAPATVSLGQGVATPISSVSIFESGNTTGETFTVTVSDTNGVLSASGAGVTGSGSTSLTIAGSLAQVNNALSTLSDTDGTAPSDTIALGVTDGFGNSSTKSIGVSVSQLAPVLTAPATATVTQGTATAISSISLAEPNNVAGETFTVTLSDTNGLLAATGTGVSGSGTKALTITGSLAQVNSDLGTLTDTDGVATADTITVAATDSFGNAAANKSIAVSVSSALTPVITAPASAAVGVGKAGAIAGISLAETGNSAGETFTVTLGDTNGLLSATGTAVSGSGTKALTVTGSLSVVNAALATLTDTDSVVGADTITLGASDSFGNTATAKTIAVTADGLPVLTAPSSATVGVGKAIAVAGVSLAETGDSSSESFTVTLADTNGLLSATGTGVSG